MKKTTILTVSGLALLPFAIFQIYINYPLVAQITGFVAFLLVYADTLKTTGKLQHFSLLIIAVVLSVAVEWTSHGLPFAAAALLLATVGLIVRMVFIKFFSYSRFPFLELLISLTSASLIGLKLYFYTTDWFGFFPAYIIWLISLLHTTNIIRNAVQLSKGAKDGYKASVGIKAPDFLLPDQFGNGISLSDFMGKRHVLLIFVRGDWCPYCHMILRTYMRESLRFQQKNIMLLAIGPDPVGINKEMAEKLGLDYLVLSDYKMKVAQEYGIRLPDFELPGATEYEDGMPLPASFLIDKNGTVVYSSRTEKPGEFLDPRIIFPILERLN